MEAGSDARFFLAPAVSSDQMLANMRSSLQRGLQEVTACKPHKLTLSVAGGGPSLQDTYPELDGVIAGVNGSLRFLLEREIKEGASYICGIMDAGEHIADMIVADPRVRYYVASVCHPSVFDKLEGCDVRLWHISPESTEDPEGVEAILNEYHPNGWQAIGGGCTMGLRWINLGYVLGFRKFNLHGLDSSFREGTHAYPDRADDKEWMEFDGYKTRPNFLAQVYDFFDTVNRFSEPDVDPIDIKMFGDGLLQSRWAEFQRENDPKPLICCVKTGDKYGPEYVINLRNGIARHFPGEHNFVCFTDKPVPGVQCYPLPADLPGWWAKLGLFKLKRPLIYFDLDVVITGSLQALECFDRFTILKDWWLPTYNSSVMVLTGKEGAVWDNFKPEMMANYPWGDQEYITHAMPGAQTFPETYFPSFKASGIRPGAMAVVFHGHPKPHELGGWVADEWYRGADGEDPTFRIRAKELLSRLPPGPVTGVEVGVFMGSMSVSLLERADLSLCMVDSWKGKGADYIGDSGDYHAGLSQAAQNEHFKTAARRTAIFGNRALIVRKPSIEAAKDFEDGSLDFVFIDADHSYEGCRADIAAWMPKIKPGGLLSGHDYDHPDFPFGVKHAVDELGLKVELGDDMTWFIQLPTA